MTDVDARLAVVGGMVVACCERFGLDADAVVAAAPRLFACGSFDPSSPGAIAAVEQADRQTMPDALGAAYEQAIHPDRRKAGGIVYTPPELADGLVAAALDGVGADALRSCRVIDPACGGGAFLLAAARALQAAAGLGPGEIVRSHLWGLDVDPGAVAVAEAALGLWAALEDVDTPDTPDDPDAPAAPGAHVSVGDALIDDPVGFFDLVVGNPPFLGQLREATRHGNHRRAALTERWRDVIRPYTDASALFLLAGRNHLAPGGRMVLVQPLSLLAARDASAVRAAALNGARLRGLWIAPEPVFGAAVRTCAPIIEVATGPTGPGASLAMPVARWVGPRAEQWPAVTSARIDSDDPGASWAPLALDVLGVPQVALTHNKPSSTVGDLAAVTAGFRDEFYGLAPYVHELPDGAEPDSRQWAPLITCGLIHPGWHGWGSEPTRFAKRRWIRPAVDLVALRAGDPKLARWVDARLRPKVVVATQTRIVEVAADPAGTVVPSVPVISVEPADAADVNRLAAALSAPPITAWALGEVAGTGLSAKAVKLSARTVASIPLPLDRDAWADAASAFAAGKIGTFAAAATAAYGLAADHPVVEWWLAVRGDAKPQL